MDSCVGREAAGPSGTRGIDCGLGKQDSDPVRGPRVRLAPAPWPLCRFALHVAVRTNFLLGPLPQLRQSSLSI